MARRRVSAPPLPPPPPVPVVHHLHHAHLVTAFVVMLLAAVMALVTYNNPVNAQSKPTKLKTVCDDQDKQNQPVVLGKVTLYELDRNGRKTKAVAESQIDACVSGQKVAEFFCAKDGSIASQTVACPTGTKCVKGACALPPPPPPPVSSEAQLKKNGVSVLFAGSSKLQGIDNSWCQLTYNPGEVMTCIDSGGTVVSPSCQDGAPVNPSCGGKATSDRLNYTNLRCYPVKEAQVCKDKKNSYGGDTICTVGTESWSMAPVRGYCQDPGPNFSCTIETDSGNDPALSGRVTVVNNYTRDSATYTDSCSGSNLTEYYCSEKTLDKFVSSTVSCPGGCSNGACQPGVLATGPAPAVKGATQLSVVWSPDSPTGVTTGMATAIVGKFVVTAPNNDTGLFTTIRSINLAITQTGIALSGTRELRIYKDGLSTTPVASYQWNGETGEQFGNTTITDAQFTDVTLGPGASKTFFVTLDTIDASTNDSLAISMEANDIEWSFGGATMGTSNVFGLPLVPRILNY